MTVLAYHLIWGAYGCWLPNDPRGSSSHGFRVDRLGPLGELHPGRKKEQPPPEEIRAFYEEADDLLAHRRYTFEKEDIPILADSFAATIAERRYTCHGCAIMFDHVHMLICRHRDRAETMIETFQERSRDALIAAKRRPANHPVWGGPGWKVFLNTPDDIRRVIRYIGANPARARRPEQRWPFVRPYQG